MRRIVSAKIKFLSLVPKGANQLPVIYKADDAVELSSLVKAGEDFEERGELLSVVYAPELRDSQGDIASGNVIKQMMYDAAREGFDLDIRHDGKALSKNDAYVAESFVIQKGDQRFADMKNYKGEPVDVTGGWATVIKIEDEGLRKAYREGEWNGVSMAGTAEFTEDTNKEDQFLDRLASLLKTTDPGDIDMKPEELTKLLAENNKALIEGIAKALNPESSEEEGVLKQYGSDCSRDDCPKKKGVAKGDDCPVQKPVLKNAVDPKAVAEYQKELVAYNLAKDVDWEDADQVAEYHKAISETAEEEVSDDDANIGKEDSDEVKSLKKQLAKAQRKSNAGNVAKQDAPAGDAFTAVVGGFSKEEQELLSAGRKIGQEHNKLNGIK